MMAESLPQWMSSLSRRWIRRDQTSPTHDRKDSITKGYMNVEKSYTLNQTQIDEFDRLESRLQAQYQELQNSRASVGKGRSLKQTSHSSAVDQKKSSNGSLRFPRKIKTWPMRNGTGYEQIRAAETGFIQAAASLASFMETIKVAIQQSPRIDTTEALTETTRTKASAETDEHSLLAKYYDTAGLVKLIYQELIDEDWQYHDEKVHRNLLIDQERPLSIAESIFEATHTTKRKQLEDRLDDALAEADNLRDACITNGLRIEMPEEPEPFNVQLDATTDTYAHREISQSEPTSPDVGEADIDAALAIKQARMTSISHNDLRSSVNSWMQTVDSNDQETEQTESKATRNTNQISPDSAEPDRGIT